MAIKEAFWPKPALFRKPAARSAFDPKAQASMRLNKWSAHELIDGVQICTDGISLAQTSTLSKLK